MRTQIPILLTCLTHSRCSIKTCWMNEWMEWDGILPRAPSYVLRAGSPYFSSVYTCCVFFFPYQAGLGVVLISDMTLISPSRVDATPCALLIVDTEFNFFNQNVFYKSLLIPRRWFFFLPGAIPFFLKRMAVVHHCRNIGSTVQSPSQRQCASLFHLIDDFSLF